MRNKAINIFQKISYNQTIIKHTFLTMKKILSVLSALIILVFNTNAQNIGINNTNPKVAVDINGGLATRTKVATPSGNAVNIPANASFVIESGGAATGIISCLYPSPYIDGQRMVIYNSNSGGYDLDFLGTKIPLNQGREFICGTLSGWVLLSGTLSTEGWGLKGNAGTDTSVNFIGTTDDQPLKFKVNKQPAGLLDANYRNTALGALAYSKFNGNFSAVANVAIGANALSNDTLGNGNTAVGHYAMEGTGNAGGANTGVGSYTLQNVEGVQNSAFGGSAMAYLRTGNFNTALGAYAYSNTTSGTGNTAVGVQSMYGGGSINFISGNYNTAVGMFSLKNNIICNGAVAIGHEAAFSDTAAEGIVAIGRAALYYNNGHNGNVAIGDSSLFNNARGGISLNLNKAVHNTAVGNKALFENIEGEGNTALGYQALRKNKNASGNTGIGHLALYTDSSGEDNTALGWDAMYSMKSGSSNTAIGHSALFNNITGTNNIALGKNSMLNATGSFSIGIGSGALENNTNNANVAVGINALTANITGSNNVAIGNGALRNATGGYNVAVGIGAGTNETSSYKLYIENSIAGKDSALIYGDFAADSLLLNAKTVVRNNAVVRGFTKLGGYSTDVPSIKMKKLTGVNGTAGTTTPFLHGLTQSKILSISVLINASTSNDIPPRSTYAGFEYDYYVSPTNIFIKNIVGNDGSITNRPVRILITYEE
jgi:hypothetical protein